MIANCDTILDIDEVALAEQHHTTGAGLTIALTKNKGVPNQDAYCVGYDSAIVHCAEVTKDIPSPEIIVQTDYWASSTGMLVADSELLNDMRWTPNDGPLSLYRDVVGFALGQGALYGYNNGESLFIDVGTVDTWNTVQAHSELVQSVLAYGNGS